MRLTKRIDNKKTAALLNAAFEKRKVIQSIISAQIGLNQGQISRLLSGQFKRPSKGLNALCRNLGVQIAYDSPTLSLAEYPDLSACLAEFLDGSKTQEKAVVSLLKSARKLS